MDFHPFCFFFSVFSRLLIVFAEFLFSVGFQLNRHRHHLIQTILYLHVLYEAIERWQNSSPIWCWAIKIDRSCPVHTPYRLNFRRKSERAQRIECKFASASEKSKCIIKPRIVFNIRCWLSQNHGNIIRFVSVIQNDNNRFPSSTNSIWMLSSLVPTVGRWAQSKSFESLIVDWDSEWR